MSGRRPCLLSFFIISLALFFGLFFGLNYPEIVRHGWPMSQCTVRSSQIVSRYCCEATCDTNTCRSAPSGSPSCGTVISQLDNGYTPEMCALNSTCPPDIGSVCSGGYYCCDTCCQTCQSCTTSCSGNPPTCTTSCTTYTCGCSCCDGTQSLYCTISCPICYDVNLNVTYKILGGALENATYTQDFGQNNATASAFLSQHLVNGTYACHYNPHHVSQVLFDVSFTAWKWAISAVFGMLPLLLMLSLVAFTFMLVPFWRLCRDTYLSHRDPDRAKEQSTGITESKDEIDVVQGIPTK